MLAFRDQAKAIDPLVLLADAIGAGVDINRLATPTKQDRMSLRALKVAVAISRALGPEHTHE